MRTGEKIALLMILIVAAVSRFYGFSDFSLSNDELSALARLNYDSFYDLIMEAVRIDGHPPAAQVLSWYMTRWFGDSVFVVRFPFVLAGLASVYFVFKMGKEWISTTVGLLAAAFFATLAFPILYSRLARPYALGMLFVSMASFFWIRIVKKKEKPSDYLWLALSLALCGFSHYFAALVGAILSLTGLLLVGKSRLVRYCLALLGGFVLFAPYIPIFLYQLNTGGVGQWLGPPENDWLWNHIDYAFNNSSLIQIAALIVGVRGFTLYNQKKNMVNHVLPFVLFLLPFLVGFFYSRWVNPVLQNSTLIFSFPFFLVFLFSGWKDHKSTQNLTAVYAIAILVLMDTVISNRFYKTNHFGVFKEVAEHVATWNQQVEEDALLIGDYNAPFYIHYYLDEIDSLEFDQYRTTDLNGLRNLKTEIINSDHLNAIYSWSTVNQAPEVEEVIREKYWKESDRKTYFNSEAVWFEKAERPRPHNEFEFENNSEWSFNPDKVLTDSVTGNQVRIDGESPYGPTYTMSLDSTLVHSGTEIITRIEFEGLTADSEVQLVYEQANDEGGYIWESDLIGRQVISNTQDWAVVHSELKPNENPGSLKMYLWSPKGEEFLLNEMKVWKR